jgi:hypothetical protein
MSSRPLLRRPSPAMVVAFMALLVSLGGTSYAITALPAKSVGAKQLKSKAVTTPKIKNNAVTGAKVRRGSLTGSDIKADTLGKVDSAAAADRATTAGTADKAAVASRLEKGDVNQTNTANPGGGAVTTATATCDAGLKAISAGVQVQNPETQFVIDLYPTGLDTWAARVSNDGTTGGNFTVFVICGAVDSVTF